MDRQTGRQTDRQTDGRTNGRTYGNSATIRSNERIALKMMASSQLVYQQPMARVHHEILTTGLNLEISSCTPYGKRPSTEVTWYRLLTSNDTTGS